MYSYSCALTRFSDNFDNISKIYLWAPIVFYLTESFRQWICIRFCMWLFSNGNYTTTFSKSAFLCSNLAIFDAFYAPWMYYNCWFMFWICPIILDWKSLTTSYTLSCPLYWLIQVPVYIPQVLCFFYLLIWLEMNHVFWID